MGVPSHHRLSFDRGSITTIPAIGANILPPSKLRSRPIEMLDEAGRQIRIERRELRRSLPRPRPPWPATVLSQCAFPQHIDTKRQACGRRRCRDASRRLLRCAQIRTARLPATRAPPIALIRSLRTASVDLRKPPHVGGDGVIQLRRPDRADFLPGGDLRSTPVPSSS